MNFHQAVKAGCAAALISMSMLPAQAAKFNMNISGDLSGGSYFDPAYMSYFPFTNGTPFELVLTFDDQVFGTGPDGGKAYTVEAFSAKVDGIDYVVEPLLLSTYAVLIGDPADFFGNYMVGAFGEGNTLEAFFSSASAPGFSTSAIAPSTFSGYAGEYGGGKMGFWTVDPKEIFLSYGGLSISITTAPVPEPGSLALMAAGAAWLAGAGRRRNSAA